MKPQLPPVPLIRLHYRVKLSGLGTLILEPIRGEVFNDVHKDRAVSDHVDAGNSEALHIPMSMRVKEGDIVCGEFSILPGFEPMSYVSDDSFMD